MTIGLATEGYLKTMLAEPFTEFTFSPVGVSVYPLGNYGVAAEAERLVIDRVVITLAEPLTIRCPAL